MAGAVELRAPTDRPNLFYAVRGLASRFEALHPS